MSDPRIPRGDTQPWPGGRVSPSMELWHRVAVFRVELNCPDCQRGRLVTNGEASEQGNVHVCNSCSAKFIVPGEPYPRRAERIDTNAQPLRGDNYAHTEI